MSRRKIEARCGCIKPPGSCARGQCRFKWISLPATPFRGQWRDMMLSSISQPTCLQAGACSFRARGPRMTASGGSRRPTWRAPPSREALHGSSRKSFAPIYPDRGGTAVAVFEQLAAEGYVTAAAGRGTHVASSLPDNLFTAVNPRAFHALFGRIGVRAENAVPGASAHAAPWLRLCAGQCWPRYQGATGLARAVRYTELAPDPLGHEDVRGWPLLALQAP
jgi:hypothetical protein